jgi:hypothetical protein
MASICSMVTGNLVGNCGFETGDFTDWTLAGGLGGVNPNAGVEGQDPVDNLFPNSGDDQAWFSDLDVSPDWDVLTQNSRHAGGGRVLRDVLSGAGYGANAKGSGVHRAIGAGMRQLGAGEPSAD